jgi:ectoine hydroxylase-related dioxygenase (phytanoyl-CoA dioxygenase family)
VRGILFDKLPEANWKVPWHQDLSIAVRGRVDVAGFGPWSVKAGVPHVQPPLPLLENMLALRLHLDDCDAANGPLRVIPRSHTGGRLSPTAIRAWRSQQAAVACLVPRGGALLMRPLLLHASSPALRPGHRRVIHLEFAAEGLPGGLQWCAADPAGEGESPQIG